MGVKAPRQPRFPVLLKWLLPARFLRCPEQHVECLFVFVSGSAGQVGENPPHEGGPRPSVLESLKLAPQIGWCPLLGFSFFFCVLRSLGWGALLQKHEEASFLRARKQIPTSISVRRGEES